MTKNVQIDRINLCPKCYPEKKLFLSYNPKKRGFVICPVHGEMKWPIEGNTTPHSTKTMIRE